MKSDERAELIGAVAQTTEMVSGLADLLENLLDAAAFGRFPSAEEIAQTRQRLALWREQVARLRQRIGSATIEPPRRVQ